MFPDRNSYFQFWTDLEDNPSVNDSANFGLMQNVFCHNLYDGLDADGEDDDDGNDDVMLTQVAPFKHGALRHGSCHWHISPQNPSAHWHRNACSVLSPSTSCGRHVPSLRHGALWQALNEVHFSPDQPVHQRHHVKRSTPRLCYLSTGNNSTAVTEL